MFSPAYYAEMNRREILKALIDDRFSGHQADFARAIKKAPAQVNQWLTGHRALGDAGARNIELRLGLPPGFFDRSTYSLADEAITTPRQDECTALLEAWKNLLPEEQNNELDRIMQMARHNIEVMQKLTPYKTVSVSRRRARQVDFTLPKPDTDKKKTGGQ